MQIVIKIDEKDKQYLDKCLKGKGLAFFENAKLIKRIILAVFHGTPLPKGHGRLKDIDEIEWYGCTSELDCPHKNRECKDCDRAECSKPQVDGIPTIIEADGARENEVS